MTKVSSTTASLLHTLARILHQQDSIFQRELHELTVLQAHALKMIKVQQKMSMGELAEALQVTPASATALTDRLIKTGWVVRHSSEEDRRLIHLSLAPEKYTQLQAMLKHKNQHLEEAIEHLNPEEQVELEKVLNKLLTILNPN